MYLDRSSGAATSAIYAWATGMEPPLSPPTTRWCQQTPAISSEKPAEKKENHAKSVQKKGQIRSLNEKKGREKATKATHRDEQEIVRASHGAEGKPEGGTDERDLDGRLPTCSETSFLGGK